MRVHTLAVLIPLALAAPAAAQRPQTYASESGFAVDLPAAWQRVPEQALRLMREGTAGQNDGLTYEAAFVAGELSRTPPGVLLLARMDYGDEVTLEQFAAEFGAEDAQARMQDAVDRTPAAEVKGRMGVPWWDSANRAAWVRMAIVSDGESPSYAWSASMLHPGGRAMVLLVYYGMPGDDEEQVLAALKSIIRSLRPS